MEYLLTKTELEKLENRLEELEREEAKLYSEMKEMAKEDNDCVGSFAYERLRQKLRFDIPAEKDRIKRKIVKAKIVENITDKFDGETVAIYTKVTLDYEGEKETFSILPVSENRYDEDVISCEAPIAEQILGKKKGDSILFNGINVKIVDVEKI